MKKFTGLFLEPKDLKKKTLLDISRGTHISWEDDLVLSRNEDGTLNIVVDRYGWFSAETVTK